MKDIEVLQYENKINKWEYRRLVSKHSSRGEEAAEGLRHRKMLYRR